MPSDDTWHMTADQQVISLFIAALVILCIAVGLVSVWRDWKKSWSIEDLTDHYYMDRDQHRREPMQGWTQ